MYFDAHCHLMEDNILKTSIEKGVGAIVLNTTKIDEWEKAIAISQKFKECYPCIGIHPWFLDELESDWFLKMDAFLKHYPNLMVGEVGLDYLKADKEKQLQVFERILILAQQYNRPIHIHCVKGWHDMLFLIKKYKKNRFLFHHFSASTDIIQELKKYDVYFSIASDKNLKELPLDKILVETDSPNHDSFPEDVVLLVEKLGLKKEQLWQNFQNFLKRG